MLSDRERKTLRAVERHLMLGPFMLTSSTRRALITGRPTGKIAIVVAVLLSAFLSALLLIAGLLSAVLTFAAVGGLIWVAWRYSDRTSRQAT